jgi:hypothetical protein
VNTIDPALIELLVTHARSSPETARLAQINPRLFVMDLLRLHPNEGLSSSALENAIGSGIVAVTTWAGRWLQPTHEP